MSEVALADAVRRVTEHGRSTTPSDVRRVLREDVHDVVMRLTTALDAPPAEFLSLAAAVRECVPTGIEDAMRPRVAIFVRLLRHGALEPAWTLAHDNASGVVQPDTAASMWAGGTYLTAGLPLPTVVEDACVFAWLPGFRDPRWDVPDEVYAVDRWVTLRAALDEAYVRQDTLMLRGSAFLGLLTAGPDDRITFTFATGAGAERQLVAGRARRPDHVRLLGPDLARLEWTGWRAEVDLTTFEPGRWHAELTLDQGGVRRTAALDKARGPLAEPAVAPTAHRAGGRTVRWERHDGRVSLRVEPRRAGLGRLAVRR